MQQAACDLIDRTVSTDGDDVVVALSGRTARQLLGMPRLPSVGEEKLKGRVLIGTP